MPGIPTGSAMPPAPVPTPLCPRSAAWPRGGCWGLGPLSIGGAGGIWSAEIFWWFLPTFGFCPNWSETKAFSKLPANWQLLMPCSSTAAPSPCQINPQERRSLSTRSCLSQLLLSGAAVHGTPETRAPDPSVPAAPLPGEPCPAKAPSRPCALASRGGFLHPHPCDSSRSVIQARMQPQPRGWGQ